MRALPVIAALLFAVPAFADDGGAAGSEEKLPPLKVTVDRDKVDLDAHRLELSMSREAKSVKIRVLAEDGNPGTIINISSTSAQSGEGSPHYCTSKAAVIGLTRQLARELAPRKIRVNAVAPGPTNTPIMQGIPPEWIASMEASVPLGRLADPSEIASAVAFLASEDASFVNGSVLVANGASYYF